MNESETGQTIVVTYLLADDHEGFRRALRSHLPGDHFEVVESTNGQEAVEAYERYHPDWTLMDLEMPGMDGLTATREIVRRHGCARVVILTQHTGPVWQEAALAAGAHAFVSKNDLSELHTILQQQS